MSLKPCWQLTDWMCWRRQLRLQGAQPPALATTKFISTSTSTLLLPRQIENVSFTSFTHPEEFAVCGQIKKNESIESQSVIEIETVGTTAARWQHKTLPAPNRLPIAQSMFNFFNLIQGAPSTNVGDYESLTITQAVCWKKN